LAAVAARMKSIMKAQGNFIKPLANISVTSRQ
jgi:hypothetical protein